ncbi:MAG: DUF3313 domain-containing protein [Kiritimatiellae bacterium]|nr:DUF3313 domain-containing protein [Kiritimatiellia bacterium]
MHKRSLLGAQCLILMPLLAIVVGCSTTYQTYHAQQSGFLGDYSQLRKGRGAEALWVYLNTNCNILAYTSIMVDPVTLYLSRGNRMHKLPKEDVQAIVNYFAASLREQLGKVYPLVEQPGPGVLRFRVAMTDMQESKVLLDTVSTLVPIGLAVSGLERVVIGRPLTVGESRMELEVLDAHSGVRMAALVDERAGSKFTGKFDKWNKWQDVRDSCDYWAARARDRLAEFRARKQMLATKAGAPPAGQF